MKQTFKKSVSLLLAFVMVIGVFVTVPFTAYAASIDYTEDEGDYYNLISKKDWELAPGIVESEIVLNNDAGSHRQVAHVVEVDLNNPYTKVIPSSKGMIPTPGSYGVQIMSEQAKWAEANGYGNVVAAMNISLSWYDSSYYIQHPELVGEPLGYLVLDGEVYKNSQGQTSGAQTCVVINFDEKNGEVRPADMPKVLIRSTADPITGWEEQVIPANFGFLVKDGKNQYNKDNNANNGASRSFVGLKADGTFVMVMNDGRQSPFSAGFTNYEMAEFMLSLGCVVAVNGDGGGSSAFLSQRPGEELKINCSPSDGAERPTTHGILVISTAPATGEFARANITAENDYYTPGSTVEFSALGTDLVGTPADIPSDAIWQLADPSMGTIEDGVFVSNGKVGTATAQLVWNGEVVGSASVEIVVPTEFTFIQSVMTVPFNKEVNVGLKATINGGLIDVVIKPSDVVLTTTNDKLGTFDGFMFTSVSEDKAPTDLTSTLTATLVHNTALVATASLSLGKGSEVLFDFEDPSDIDGWNIADVNGNDKGFYQHLSYATAENGQVHDGVGSMRVEMNPIAANGISSGGYGQSDLFLDNGVVVKNAKSIGFWAYIPDEYEHCWIRVLYWYDSNNDGKYDKKNTITVINQPEVYDKWDESGWKYFSVDVSAYSEILIPGLDCKDKIAYNASKNDANNFRFIEFMFPHTNTNALWQTHGTINGLQTVYVDNITADFSDAVDDREAPIFSKVELAGNDTGIELKKYETVTTTSNLLTISATVAENTAKTNATGLNATSTKAYVDGVEVPVTFANGRMTISDVAVADGIHRVKFEICDNMGNKSVVIRLIKVVSGVDASTVQLVPADPNLNNLYGGSIYWMNMNANKIETIQSVKAVIDLNYGNHFELDNMILADGFTAEYTIDEENNTATIVITRVGNNTQVGAATLASLPIRVIYYDTDINIDGYTAETYWNTYGFWPYDLKVDVDMGEITYIDGYTSNVIGAFSNEEFSVDTELQAGFSDAGFKADRGTAHVHTPVALDDKAATCTEAGYTGRTYCEVCDSIVDWGTILPVATHTYEIVNGKLTCVVGGELFNGVYTDGKTYIDGVAVLDGWSNNNTSYYKDGVALIGSHFIDGQMYTFDENGIIQPDYKYNGFYEINDTIMYFVNNEYQTGYQWIETVFYNFDKNGYAYDGEVEINGTECLFDNGVSVETNNVRLAGICGENVYYVLYRDGRMVIDGEGDMMDFSSWPASPWWRQEYRFNIKKIIIGEGITKIGHRAFVDSYATEIVFAENSKLKEISTHAFSQMDGLTSVTIPEGVKLLNVQAFYKCPNLVDVYIPVSMTKFISNTFTGSPNVVLHVPENSSVIYYAEQFGIKYDVYATAIAGGNCGDNARWEMWSDGTLKIVGTGAMTEFAAGAAPWHHYLYRNNVKKIVIGKDITSVGSYSFFELKNATEVVFEAGSKVESIGMGAFGYTGITEIAIPATVKTIGVRAFYFCGALTDVAFEDGSVVTSIGDYAFRDAIALTNVFIPDSATTFGTIVFYNVSGVTLNVAKNSVAHKYAQRYNLATVVREPLPTVEASGNCGDNARWEMWSDGTLKIVGTGAMTEFAAGAAPWHHYLYRNNVKKIVIGKDITSVGSYSFFELKNATEVVFECTALESIGEGAFGYTGIIDIVVPKTVKTIGAKAFYFCKSLVKVEFEANSVLFSIGSYAFRDTVALEEINIPTNAKVGTLIFYNSKQE